MGGFMITTWAASCDMLNILANRSGGTWEHGLPIQDDELRGAAVFDAVAFAPMAIKGLGTLSRVESKLATAYRVEGAGKSAHCH